MTYKTLSFMLLFNFHLGLGKEKVPYPGPPVRRWYRYGEREDDYPATLFYIHLGFSTRPHTHT